MWQKRVTQIPIMTSLRMILFRRLNIINAIFYPCFHFVKGLFSMNIPYCQSPQNSKLPLKPGGVIIGAVLSLVNYKVTLLSIYVLNLVFIHLLLIKLKHKNPIYCMLFVTHPFSCAQKWWPTPHFFSSPLPPVLYDQFLTRLKKFPALRFWWVIITTIYHFMLQSWYQNTPLESLVKTLL